MIGGNYAVPAQYRWDVAAGDDSLDGASTGLHPLLACVLRTRDLRDPAKRLAFFAGESGQIHEPFDLLGMDGAVDRILRARDRQERIAVYGDYDADGVASTALLVECLRHLGCAVIWHVPHRENDGYGLNDTALAAFHRAEVKLVVTVDCGISNAAEVEKAGELGLDVIVTDHHTPPPRLPGAVAVINPHQPGCAYPFKELAGVGVTLKLAQALLEQTPVAAPSDLLESWYELAAIGTFADVVPLIGENRVIVARGLAQINRKPRPGIQALLGIAGLSPGQIRAEQIAFSLAPRLNAVGRLDSAQPAVNLLLARNVQEIGSLPSDLNKANGERQRLTREAVGDVEKQIDPSKLPPVIVAASADYRPGIVGLVAGRLTEKYHRPSLVVNLSGSIARGSARSIAGFHITEALTACSDLLQRFGGHAQAAGFTLLADNLPELERRLTDRATTLLTSNDLAPRLAVDAHIVLADVNLDAYQHLRQLDPLGSGNPVPLFLTEGLHVQKKWVVGREVPGHLKLRLTDGQQSFPAIAFGRGKLLSQIGETVDVVYEIRLDEYAGTRELILGIKDLRSY